MSEADRISRLTTRFAAPELVVPPGDDASVVRPSGALAVTSVDSLVEGVDFTLETWPAEAIGRKAIASAISDLAAMGARPGEIHVAAGLPRELSDESFDRIAAGIAEAADASGAIVAGGDLSGAGELWLAVTVTGYADSVDGLVTRSGASEGEVVVVTGELGGSRRAVELIADGAPSDDPRLARQFDPQPRIEAGRLLAESGAGAMIDISDGLARDAGHIATSSSVGIDLQLGRLPLADGIDDPAWAAGSGEEYELLATLKPDRLGAATEALLAIGVRLTAIGSVTRGDGARLLDASGADIEVRGFDHFD
ncbi:MAG: thiamine-phosphate kinase [Solirubrobacterales bacterium]